MKYCTNCGNELHGEKFCVKCGTRTENGVSAEAVTPMTEKKGGRLIGKVIGLIVVVGIIITGAFLLRARSYETVVEDYIQATISGDAEKIISLLPGSLIEYIAEEEYDGDKKEMIYELEDEFDNIYEQLEEYGIDLKTVSYEILETEDMDADEIDDICDEYRRADLKIKEGKEVEVELKIPVDGEERSTSLYMNIVKIGRSWYLIIDM